MSQNKLFVCLDESNKISLHTREELDIAIKESEEDIDTELSYTVIGSITGNKDLIPFYMVAKVGTATIYDVIEAKTEEEAVASLLKSRRFVGKQVKVLHTRNLAEIIKQYYE